MNKCLLNKCVYKINFLLYSYTALHWVIYSNNYYKMVKEFSFRHHAHLAIDPNKMSPAWFSATVDQKNTSDILNRKGWRSFTSPAEEFMRSSEKIVFVHIKSDVPL